MACSQLRYYVGTFVAKNQSWTYSELWRDLAPDAALNPSVNGDPCLLYSERFPHDILADDTGGVLALYRADNQIDANNSLQLYDTTWPLLSVKTVEADRGHVVTVRSRDLGAAAVLPFSVVVLPPCSIS